MHRLPEQQLRHWLALWRCDGIGPASFASIIEHLGDAQTAFDSDSSTLSRLGLKQQAIDALQNPDWEGADNDLEWLQQDNHHLLSFQDPEYPKRLLESPRPPPILFIVGNPAVLQHEQIAMVGSRNPTADGRRNAQEFARHLAASGLTITSGMAIGIDSLAHQGALDVDGTTIAVTGTGPDRIYPARNRKLAHAIAEQGAIITEFPTGTPALSQNFPRRNRVISALSLGTLVVEAAVKSGSLITARYATEQAREVFAIPGSIHNPLARGCHKLIRDGAKLVETAMDVIEELLPLVTQTGIAQQDINIKEENTPTLDQEYQQLLEQMGFSPVSIDTLVTRCSLTAEEVSSMMLILELQGLVAPSPGGCYIRVK